VIREVQGFHQDEEGDWVAELSCLHGQHVRDRPPIWPRPWVTTAEGRAEHLGSELDCPLCDRLELPEGLTLARTAGPFDADSLPAGLRRTHLVADRTWAVLRVLDGAVTLHLQAQPIPLTAGDRQPIPPGVPHQLELDGPFRVEIDFLVR
jgi:mannose-6-phosphate isomerase-like protein (cupin superfamily)